MMSRLRAYHAALAVLTVAAFLSGEAGLIHAWLGYGVAAVIALRLVWALSGARVMGLSRFYPVFQGLRLNNAFTHPAISRTLLFGIGLCLITVTVTGLAMDRGDAIGMAAAAAVVAAYADDDEKKERRGERGEKDEGLVSEAHEASGNLLMLLVALHVSYLFLFKRPLARYMLFLDTPLRKTGERKA